MATINQHLTLSEGETRDVVCTITNSFGGATNLEGYDMYWRASTDYDNTASIILDRSGSDFNTTSASNGMVIFSISSSDTVSMSGRYKHELRASDSIGNVYSLLTGELVIRKSVFHP